MAGHSHWKQIKEQKGTADQKRGRLFSKLLAAVTIAAREEPNPQFNARLRAAILKAKEEQVPQENIDRAVNKAAHEAQNLEEMVVEAYGPGGSALIIEAITDNSNRTINELKQILREHEAKLAAPGSVRWAFNAPTNEKNEWHAKFNQALGSGDKEKFDSLLRDLGEQNDVQNIYTNIK